MRRIVKTVSFILLLCFAFAGCSSISSEDNFSTLRTVYHCLTQEQRQELDRYAVSFAETFYSPFDSADALDQELIGQFAFWKIYEETEETNAEGICPIPKEKLLTYVQKHFGISGYDYPEALPEYDSQTQSYLFYPLGEGSLVTASIAKVEDVGEDMVCYTMEMSKESMSPGENPERSQSWISTYQFRLLEVADSYILQAVSAK